MSRHVELSFDLVAEGELDVRRLIGGRRSFEDAQEVYASLLRNRSDAMGILFQWPRIPEGGNV